ncbi:MAG TPA: HlyU family transcriptional regulator [Xanthobacteraceae bacterium]|nr:HlyU family transcriptional regulator [Xanthobacteraceae bacterium]
MSFWKTLFGKPQETPQEQPGEPVEYNGFTIRAAPFKDGGQYQTAGIIEKEIGGVRREHRFIRADRHLSHEDAAAFSLTKARQLIDQMGERIFDQG